MKNYLTVLLLILFAACSDESKKIYRPIDPPYDDQIAIMKQDRDRINIIRQAEMITDPNGQWILSVTFAVVHPGEYIFWAKKGNLIEGSITDTLKINRPYEFQEPNYVFVDLNDKHYYNRVELKFFTSDSTEIYNVIATRTDK